MINKLARRHGRAKRERHPSGTVAAAFCRMTLLVAALLSSVSAGADLSDGFVLCAPKVEINGGKSLDLLVPAPGGKWHDFTPFVEPDGVEVWAKGGRTAQVESVAFTPLFDEIRQAELQAWIDGRWQHIADVPPGEKGVTIRLSKPVSTAGLRLWITQQANTDLGSLEVMGWRIDGQWAANAPAPAPTLELACEAPFNVYDLPAAAQVRLTLRVPGNTARSVTLETAWTNMIGQPAVEPHRQSVSVPAGAPLAMTEELRGVVQGPYVMTVKLLDEASALLAARNILVGLRDPKILTKGEVEPLIGDASQIKSIDQRLKELGSIWSTEVFHVGLGMGTLIGGDFLQRAHDAGADLVSTYLTYPSFEPLPGVYNFATFDQMVANARQTRIGLSLGVWRWEFGDTLQQYWMADQRAAVLKGDSSGGWSNQFSIWAPEYRRHAERAMEVLVKRYGQCPEVWMWHPHPFGMVDHDTPGLFDGSEHALHAYRAFLQQRFQRIELLNASYGTNHARFDEVSLPRPLWKDMKEDVEGMARVLDTRPVWRDYLEFMHDAVVDIRRAMFEQIRRWDDKRGLEGMGSEPGVGKADATWAVRKQYNSFDGDTGINLIHYVRRLAARQRYGLAMRYEDIQTVQPGRSGFDLEGVRDRGNWDIFQACLLGSAQFNYVFPTWDNSPFWDGVFANPRARQLVKEAAKSQLETAPMGYLHSFETDVYEGTYGFGNISVYRWWLMNGFSEAWCASGRFPQVFSAGGPLDGLDQMKVVFDDGSRVLPAAAVAQLVRYVEQGGRLVLLATSGERTEGSDESRFELLEQLGYADIKGLLPRRTGPADLVFHRFETLDTTGQRLSDAEQKQNVGFGSETVSMPVQFYSRLSAPQGGQVIGLIGVDPGAVVWPHGKGQVLLIAGEPGGVLESTHRRWSASADPAQKAMAAQLWKDAPTEIARIAGGLWSDAAVWAGVRAEVRVDGTHMCYALRSDGPKRMIYLYNGGDTPCSPLVSVTRRDGQTKTIQAEVESLDGLTVLGPVDVATLAAGLRVPEVPPHRLAVLRLRQSGRETR